MYKFYFFTIVKRGEKMSTSEMTTAEKPIVTLKEFADNYFATNKYIYGDNRGKLCTSFFIHFNYIEDYEDYYLLSILTASHEVIKYIPIPEMIKHVHSYRRKRGFVNVFMNKEVNVNIKVEKNKLTDSLLYFFGYAVNVYEADVSGHIHIVSPVMKHIEDHEYYNIDSYYDYREKRLVKNSCFNTEVEYCIFNNRIMYNTRSSDNLREITIESLDELRRVRIIEIRELNRQIKKRE